MDYNNLKVNQKVYYTGDQANLPAEGEIIKVYSNQFYPVLYDIALDNGEEKRISHCVSPLNFEGVGHRFELSEERETERQRKIMEFKKICV